MSEMQWTADEVQGFVARVGEFYSQLSETEQQLFADMLQDSVQDAADVAGFSASGQPIPMSAIGEALTEYLLAHPAAIS
jgi:hypothetical protein